MSAIENDRYVYAAEMRETVKRLIDDFACIRMLFEQRGKNSESPEVVRSLFIIGKMKINQLSSALEDLDANAAFWHSINPEQSPIAKVNNLFDGPGGGDDLHDDLSVHVHPAA